MKLKRFIRVVHQQLVRWFVCGLIGHRCYLWSADGATFLPQRGEDDNMNAECTRCGKTLSACCAIGLPGMRYQKKCRHEWETTHGNGFGHPSQEFCRKCGGYRHRVHDHRIMGHEEWKPGKHPKSK